MTLLKPVLIISYFFPPIGMAGSARAYGLFRYLPEYGYRPYVVTVRDIVYPAYDTTLLSEEDDRYVIRTESLDPSRIFWRLGRRRAPAPGLSKRLPKWISPDYKRLWVPFATRAAKRLIVEKNLELVVTTSPTPSAHLVGLSLQRSCGIRWLADYRDMWVTRPIDDAYSREAQKRRCNSLLREFRDCAEHVTAVNGSIAKYTQADTVIPNGVDPLSGELWEAEPPPDAVFRVGYLGTTDSAETITVFVKALAAALKERRLSANAALVKFVGAVDSSMLRDCFAEVGLLEALECRGYLPRQSAIAALAEVDALLVTIPEDLPFVTPSKVFDCLVSGKPVIALAPRGSELAKLVSAAGERVFSLIEQSALQEYLSQMIDKKSRTEVSRGNVTRSELTLSRREEYSWRAMARRFARALDGMSGVK